MCWGNFRCVRVRGLWGQGKACLERGRLTQDLKDSPLLPLYGVRTTNKEGQRQEDRDQPVLQTPFFTEAQRGQ